MFVSKCVRVMDEARQTRAIVQFSETDGFWVLILKLLYCYSNGHPECICVCFLLLAKYVKNVSSQQKINKRKQFHPPNPIDMHDIDFSDGAQIDLTQEKENVN